VHGGGTVGTPNDVPTCGLTAFGEQPCTFSGPEDIEASGGVAGFDPQTGSPAQVDWMMQVNAAPGDYDYFCYIHPGMNGKLHVVSANQSASSQAQIDASSDQQFASDQSLALQAEQQYNKDVTTTDGGTVTHHVTVGISAADNHVAIDEMLPQRIHVSNGEQVEFKWRDPHNVHTVGFAQAEQQLPEPFVFDCGNTFIAPPSGPGGPPGGGFCQEPDENLELIGDPGNAISGTPLTSPQAIVDSGFLAGPAYGIPGTIQTWSVRVDSHTVSDTYNYFCSVHDFMHGQLLVGQ
jgi:plastocyanin